MDTKCILDLPWDEYQEVIRSGGPYPARWNDVNKKTPGSWEKGEQRRSFLSRNPTRNNGKVLWSI